MAFPFSRTLSPSKHLLPGLLLTTALAPISAATLCDLNNDGTVTPTDLDIILQARGNSVITPFDPLDIDRNGVINSSDARLCVCKLPTTAACEREPNLPPLAVPGNDQTVEQGTFSSVILNGEGSGDPEGDQLSYLWRFEQRPTGSQARLSGADSARPDFVPDRYGDYRMALTVTDAFGLNSTEQVTVTIQRPPVNLFAVDDRDTVKQGGSAISGNVIGNDTPSNAQASVTTITHNGQSFTPGTPLATGSGATIQIESNGRYTYTPPASAINAPIDELFTYTITEAGGASSQATLTVVLTPAEIKPPPPKPPVNLSAADDNNSVQQGSAAISGNVLTNDNLDNANASVSTITHNGQAFVPGTALTTGSGATIQIESDGRYTYMPPTSIIGAPIEEQFIYTITEAGGGSSQATLTIRLTPAPRVTPPANLVAANDNNTVKQGNAAISGNVLTNDNLDNANASVSVIIHNGQSFAPGTALTTGSGATIQIESDGRYTYTPPASAISAPIEELFTYTITEAGGASSQATLTIRLTPAPIVKPPVNLAASNDSNSVQQGNTAISGNVLSNDDLDNTNASVSAITHNGQAFIPGKALTTGSGATIQIESDGRYTYTPPTSTISAPIEEQFIYTITEAGGVSSQATLTIRLTLAPIVKPPVDLVATADSQTAQQGKAAVSGNVILNDALDNAAVLVSEIIHNGQSFTPGIQFTTAAGGSLQLQVDGNYTYIPPAVAINSAVDEVFTYTIAETGGVTSRATLTIKLTPANKSPKAVADVAATEAGGSSVSGNVTHNDNLGDTPTTVIPLSLSTTPHGGALTLQEDGSYTYTPPAILNSAVEEIFTYTLKDHDGETSDATLTITVAANNQSPEAKADSRTTEAAATAITGNVLNNDSLGNTPTNVTVLMHNNRKQPFGKTFDTVHGGWFRLFEDGRYMYVMPEAGRIDGVVQEKFTYTLADADGESSTATLTIQVFPSTIVINNSPLAEADNAQIIAVDNSKTPLTGNVLTNDNLGDAPTLVTPIVIQPTQHGGAFQLQADGRYAYITPAVVTGIFEEIFPYTITDSDNETSDAALRITVKPPNRSPQAREDQNSASAGGSTVTGNVLTNDDRGNQPALVTPISVAATRFGGSFELQANGIYVYTPPTSLTGVINEVFTYTLTDLDGETSKATVTIRVSPLNQAPSANDDGITVQQDSSGNVVNVLFNDTDLDGDSLSIVSVTNLTQGIAVINNGNISYTPNAGFIGVDTFRYTVSDGKGGTAAAEVTIQVIAVNQAPVAIDDQFTLTGGGDNHILDLLGNDTDPVNGFVSSNNGIISYITPASGLFDNDSFTYTISDGHGHGHKDTGTVLIASGG